MLSNVGSSAIAGAGLAGARRAGARRAGAFRAALRAVFFFVLRAGLRRAADFLAFGLAFDRLRAAFLARFFAIQRSFERVPAYSSLCRYVKRKP